MNDDTPEDKNKKSAASNSVTKILDFLVEDDVIDTSHVDEILETQTEKRNSLSEAHDGNIGAAPAEERQKIMTGQLALSLADKLGYQLSEKDLSNALRRQQSQRIQAALEDVRAVKDGEDLAFESWVANLKQNADHGLSADEKITVLGDLARELAVLTLNNPNLADKTLSYLESLNTLIEGKFENVDSAEFAAATNKLLDDLLEALDNGEIKVIAIFDQNGMPVEKTAQDLIDFIEATRTLVL